MRTNFTTQGSACLDHSPITIIRNTCKAVLIIIRPEISDFCAPFQHQFHTVQLRDLHGLHPLPVHSHRIDLSIPTSIERAIEMEANHTPKKLISVVAAASKRGNQMRGISFI